VCLEMKVNSNISHYPGGKWHAFYLSVAIKTISDFVSMLACNIRV
jgi:hypothetical protein